MRTRTLLLWGPLALLPTMLVAQEVNDSLPPEIRNTSVSDSLTNGNPTVQHLPPKTWWQEMLNNTELINSFLVLLFGFLVLRLGIKKVQGNMKLHPAQYNRLVIILFIVIASMFLISAGYDNKQVAPVFGLLGTIAGYLLGRTDYREEKIAQSSEKKPATDTQKSETTSPKTTSSDKNS